MKTWIKLLLLGFVGIVVLFFSIPFIANPVDFTKLTEASVVGKTGGYSIIFDVDTGSGLVYQNDIETSAVCILYRSDDIAYIYAANGQQRFTSEAFAEYMVENGISLEVAISQIIPTDGSIRLLRFEP